MRLHLRSQRPGVRRLMSFAGLLIGLAFRCINGDGKPDLVTANIPTDLGSYSVSVLINDTLRSALPPRSGRATRANKY